MNPVSYAFQGSISIVGLHSTDACRQITLIKSVFILLSSCLFFLSLKSKFFDMIKHFLAINTAISSNNNSYSTATDITFKIHIAQQPPTQPWI